MSILKLIKPWAVFYIAALMVLTHLPTAIAQISERAALVIGNQQYAFAPLDTPESDARAMTESLRRNGFRVTRLLNLRQADMYEEIDRFFVQHGKAKVLLFYYAGHAVQLNGKNFLIPLDIRKEDPDILSRMFDLRYLLGKLTESPAETKLVILDACRDNLFSSHPNASSGLSELIAPPGTFVAFATAPGSTAEDSDGTNSPYTTALINNLFRPNIKLEAAFKEIRKRVMYVTNNSQVPWESTSLIHDFYMAPLTGLTQKKPVPASQISGTRAIMPGAPHRDSVASPGASSDRSFSGDTHKADKSACSRLLAKISIGLDPLTDHELNYLKSCKH